MAILAVVAAVLLALALSAAFVILVVRRHVARAVPESEQPAPAPAEPTPDVAAPSMPAAVARDAAAGPAVGELVGVGGPLASRRFAISDAGLTIGRHPDNDVALIGELMVSRHHAVVAVEDGQPVLYDRDSANGTWVNDQRVFRHILVPGDRVQVSQSEFVYDGPPVARQPISRPASYRPGDVLDGYLLEVLIGRGGMSEVYRARDAQGRPVAIKILCETDPYIVSKFAQEGSQIGPLLRQHPGIVSVYGFGRSQEGHLYIVMEYVDGPSLRKLLHSPLPEGQAVSIAGQICSALAFAHQRHIVHRDIKPENVLVAADTIKVVDFGVAKFTSSSTITRDKIIGTPEYLSPEQARGDPVQPASDVYSLGIVLYEMLAGRVPFPRAADEDPTRAALEVVRRHLHEQPRPIRQQNPAARISPELDRAVMRALSKEIEERFPTAREMALALGHDPGLEVPAARPPASLLIVRGARQGQSIPLAGQGTPIGRLDLDVTDQAVSRQHATIYFQDGCYWLQDTSRNGTWVDNQQVHGQVPLRSGAVIAIGNHVLTFESAE